MTGARESPSRFSELSESSFNTNNTATVSASLDIKDNKWVAWGAKQVSGGHSTHIITLQQSLDDSTWISTTSTLTGTGIVDNVQITTRYVRLKVTTAEGSASSVSIIIHGK